MPFQIVHQDITKMNTDAIVNAANSALQMGGGVCGAIFNAAGAGRLQRACREIGFCPTGSAVITPGFDLQAKYVIHAVGPIWRGGDMGERQLLEGAYRKSLELAAEKGLQSIAFPLISSGIYGYPKAEALRVAMNVFADFLTDHEMEIYLAVFDRRAVAISEKLFANIEHYIDTYYIEEPRRRGEGEFWSMALAMPRAESAEPELSRSESAGLAPLEPERMEHALAMTEKVRVAVPKPENAEPSDIPVQKAARNSSVPAYHKTARSLDDVVKNLSETFSEMLLRLIDEKGKTDVEVYKKANVDRKLFSKIRSNKDYKPKKATAIALAIGLELSLDETVDLLRKAGYSLSPSSKFDVIIRYFIEQEEYNMFVINEALFCFEQPLLGA